MDNPASYTILRIKRKRTEEPLDALVVESRIRKKKSRGGVGVFQFAQTVEDDAWKDEKRRKDLEDQISRLAQETLAKADAEAKALNTSTHPLSTSSPSAKVRPPIDDSNRRYTVLKHPSDPSEPGRFPTSPPKVLSSKDLPPKTVHPDFKMYDAILSSSDSQSNLTGDPEMDKFMPLLNDYLKLHDMSLEKNLATPPLSTSQSDDYVWDVFYHRPATLSEWNAAANVGTLTGLPPSLTDPYDSASDSEEEDEADEDSNAEEYYKNDYPEDEEPETDSEGSDEFHEHSDHDELMRYEDEEDSHDWR